MPIANEKVLITYDSGDGMLDRHELSSALASCLQESQLELNPAKTDQLADLLFTKAQETFGQDQPISSLTFDQLVKLMKDQSIIYDNLSISTFGSIVPKGEKKPSRVGYWRRIQSHAKIYTSLWVFVALMTAVSLAIGTERLYRQIISVTTWIDIPLVVAKTCGQLLNFTLSLLLLYTLKHMISWVKTTWMRHYLPLDDAVFLHKLTAVVAFLIGVIHTVAHVVLIVFKIYYGGERHDFYVQNYSVGKIYVSGVVLTLMSLAMSVLSLQAIKNKSHGFFVVSHGAMAIFWYTAMFFHAKNFIYWVLVPLSLFVLERVSLVYRILRHRSVVQQASTFGNVTFLNIKKPDNMMWSPGDYVIINIPQVSRTRWRPFTISSSQQDELTLHIRRAGVWTNQLHRMVEELQTSRRNDGRINRAFRSHLMLDQVGNLRISMSTRQAMIVEPGKRSNSIVPVEDGLENSGNASSRPTRQLSTILPRRSHPVDVQWTVYMNGPFSTPSYDILNTEHAILVAGGIGVTPFVSVLESVILQLKQCSRICPCGCGCRVWFQAGLHLKRIDFFWLTRSLESLSWFVEVFQELEDEQVELGLDPPLVNVHLYLTGLMKETDMRGTFLQLALNTAYDEKSTDLLTGLRARTKPGRPDWNSVIPKLIEEFNSERPVDDEVRPKLYACGPAQLCGDLKSHCSKLNIRYKEEVFS